MIFQTNRLEVHNLRNEHLSAFHDLQGNPNVMKFTGQSVFSPPESKANLEEVISRYIQKDNELWIWGVFLKGQEELLGTCAIVIREGENEIGYRFREKYWGNGYGFEITQGLIKHAFDTMKLESLFADVDKLNTHSVKILEKCMKFESSFWNEQDKSTDRKYTLKNEKKSN
jgi:RimJ/RimL family protein N-acetyltransferase